MSVTAILLLIPILVMLYDIFFASKSDEAMILDRKERLGNIVQAQIVPGITETMEASLKEAGGLNSISQQELDNYLHKAFNQTAEPLVPNYPGIRFGLYLPHNEHIFVQGFLHQYRELSHKEELDRERRILVEANSGLVAVVASRKPLARLTSSLNDETFEYLAPIIVDNKLVAVTWADERLHPIFAQSRSFRMINRYIILFGFFLGAIGALAVIHNLTNGISRLKKGLSEMERDITRLLPDMPGEPGQVAQAINKMAMGLAEKEKLEEELRRSERLAALGRLVTGVAHELRNPIGVVKATVQVMETELNGNTEITEYTAVIKEHVDRQNRVIQELLDFGRPSRPLIQHVSANSLLSKVLTFTGPMLRQHKINLRLNPADDIPMVSADGEKIKQVFVNLILNAIQAMPDGGELSITTYHNDEYVCIEFTDSGEGIPAENISSIFDPFYTTKDTGSGLGLSISHQIVKSHGGTIEVDSEKGRGTSLTVKLLITGSRGDTADDTQNTDY